jgi:hypothetical protein
MFLTLEKNIVKKKFIESHNKKIWSFYKKSDPTTQINFEVVNNIRKKKYKFSFPLKNSPVHYAAYFNENESIKMKKYIRFIINHYI